MGEGRHMSKPRVTFAELRRLLLDMGFTEAVTPGSHVFFAHQPTGARSPCPSTEPIGSCFLTT